MPIITPAEQRAFDIAFAKAWVAPLTQGANLERPWAWAAPGAAAAVAAYCKRIGYTHLRVFYAWRPGANMLGEGTGLPTKAQFARILDAIQIYINAGIKVILDCCDLIEHWVDITPVANAKAIILQHITNCAAWIAERNFPKTMIAIGPINELGGTSVTHYGDLKLQAMNILRAALPGYLLMPTIEGYCYFENLLSTTPWFTDGPLLYGFHSYEPRTAGSWRAVATRLRAWTALHGFPTIWAEAGFDWPANARVPAGWGANFDAFALAMADFKPVYWAWTYGLDWPMNPSPTSLTIRPEIESRILSYGAQFAANLGVVPALPAPVAPVLGGPYGLAGGETDAGQPISVVQATAWTLARVQDLLAYSEKLGAYAQANADAELAARKQAIASEAAQRAAEDLDIRADFAAADTALQTSINTKANSQSPTLNNAVLTGTTQAPTMPAGNSSQSISTTAFVGKAVSDALAQVAENFAPETDAQLLGAPTAPTTPAGNDSTRIQTTAAGMRQERYIFAQIRDTEGLTQAADDLAAAAAGVPIGRMYYGATGVVRRRMG